MTQVFGDDGSMIPVTVVEAGPCTVVGVRTKATHGYDALQIGFEPAKKNVTKAMAGHYKKAGVDKPMKVLREIRLQKTEAVAAYQQGQTLTVELFTPGEFVDVVGRDQGQGLSGRRQAPRLVRRRRDPRLDVPPGPRLHRRLVRSLARLARPQAAGAHGRRPPHRAQPAGRARHPRAEPHPAAGRDSRANTGSVVLVRKSVKQTKAQQQKAKEAK